MSLVDSVVSLEEFEMSLRAMLMLTLLLLPASVGKAQRPLPPVKDGAVLKGPGDFRYDGVLSIQGRVVLR